MLLLKQHMRLWLDSYKGIVKSESNVHKCILAIGRELKGRVFRELKHQFEQERLLRVFLSAKEVRLTQACLKQFWTHYQLQSSCR
jgi:hypothetical protein